MKTERIEPNLKTARVNNTKVLHTVIRHLDRTACGMALEGRTVEYTRTEDATCGRCIRTDKVFALRAGPDHRPGTVLAYRDKLNSDFCKVTVEKVSNDRMQVWITEMFGRWVPVSWINSDGGFYRIAE